MVTINEITVGGKGGTLVAQIAEVKKPRLVNKKDGSSATVVDIILQDNTGKAEFSVWNPAQQLVPGLQATITQCFNKSDNYGAKISYKRNGTIQFTQGGAPMQAPMVAQYQQPQTTAAPAPIYGGNGNGYTPTPTAQLYSTAPAVQPPQPIATPVQTQAVSQVAQYKEMPIEELYDVKASISQKQNPDLYWAVHGLIEKAKIDFEREKMRIDLQKIKVISAQVQAINMLNQTLAGLKFPQGA